MAFGSSSFPSRPSPRELAAMGVFLFFGAVMASFAGVTLIRRGTFLDRLWAINLEAYQQLSAYGRIIGIPFLALAAALAIAGAGWIKRRQWGWTLAVILIAMQVLGDLVNAFMGHAVKGAVGVVIAGALLVYLLRPAVRAAFRSGPAPANQ
jgi:hypothetical protein